MGKFGNELFFDINSFEEEKIKSISDIDIISNSGEEKILSKNIFINNNYKDNNENNDSFFFTIGYNWHSSFTSEIKSFSLINEENHSFLKSTHSKSDFNQIYDIDLNPVKPKRKNKVKLFRIKRDNKNKGRIKNNSNLIGKHNRFSEDNIIRKFKGRFIEKCRIYINKEYKTFLLNNRNGTNKEKDLLQRISPKLSRKIKKDDNLKWLKSKLFQVFSEDVSKKCSLYKSDYNEKRIINLYRENEAKNVINILNKSVKEMLESFIQKKIPGFDSLDDDLKDLEEKMKIAQQENIIEYLDMYRKTALNFELIFMKKHRRKNKYKNF